MLDVVELNLEGKRACVSVECARQSGFFVYIILLSMSVGGVGSHERGGLEREETAGSRIGRGQRGGGCGMCVEKRDGRKRDGCTVVLYCWWCV